jgi:hypothetical protein
MNRILTHEINKPKQNKNKMKDKTPSHLKVIELIEEKSFNLSFDLLNAIIEDCGWSYLQPNLDPDDEFKRQQHLEAKELLRDAGNWSSKRNFAFENWHDYCQDRLAVVLYSNGTAALFWSKGDIDHSTNDNRVGLYNESAETIVLDCISLWRENDRLCQFVFRKMPGGSLAYSDPEPEFIGLSRHCLVKDKMLKPVEQSSALT